MSAVGVSKRYAGRLLILAGVIVLVAMFGCEGDSDGPISPGDTSSSPATGATAVLSDFFVTIPEIIAGERDTLVAYVVDLNGDPFEGAEVLFSTSLGTFRNGRTTITVASDLAGTANAPLVTTVSDSGQAVVEAYLNGVRRRATISILGSPTEGPPPLKIDVLTVSASPRVVLADDGISSATIVARAVTFEGVAVPGAYVDFTTTAGFIVSPVQTDSKGEATTQLYSPASAATATVVAMAGGAEDNTTVLFVNPTTGYVLEVSAAPDVVRADGGTSFSVISARLLDQNRHPVEGAAVSFETDKGSIAKQATTDQDGLATANLLSGFEPGVATVIVSFGDEAETIQVVFSPTTEPTPFSVDLTADPASLPADAGVSASKITATVLNSANNPLEGVTVEFETTLGIIAGVAVTDAAGQAVADLKSSSQAGTATVTATVGSILETVNVTMVSTTDFYSIEMQATPSSIPADGGNSTSHIVATVLNSSNNPVEGVTVGFETTLGAIAGSGVTDAMGQVAVDLYSSTGAGTATVTATVGASTGTVNVTMVSAANYYNIELFAVPSTIPADGGATVSMVVATVLNSSQNPLEGVSVGFETTLGMIAGSGVTNALGQAAVTLYSAPTAGTATVTATIGTTSETVNVNMVSINDYYNIEMKAAPSAIFADNGNSTSEITATLTTSGGNPVDGAMLAFSTTAGLITESAETDSIGVATALLRSDSEAGTATVRATFAGAFYGEVDVEMLPLDTPVFTLEVNSSRPQVQVKGTGGVETADIVAMAYDVAGNPSPDGTEVTFTITDAPGQDESLADGGFGPVTVETVDGVASVPFRAGTTSGTVVIRASAGSLVSDVTPVTVASGPPAKINLCVRELNVSYCYHEPNDVCGFVCDVHNNPVANGVTVWLTVDKGCVTASAMTGGEPFTDANGNMQWDLGEEYEDVIENNVYDPMGVIAATWTDCGPGPFGIVTVTAETSGGTVTGTIDFIASGCPASVTFLSVTPSTILADGESKAIVRFQVLDGDGLYVREGTPVYFSTDWGSINPDTSFTRDGVHESVALATLTSKILTQDYSMPSTTVGDGIGVVATVTAEANFASDQATVNFATGPSDLFRSQLLAPTPMGLNSRGIITAAIRDFHDNPLGAHAIEFVCSDGLFDNGLDTITAYTGMAGVANTVYFAPADTNTVVISVRDLDARGGDLGLNRIITVR
jgi:adhesin/invasin